MPRLGGYSGVVMRARPPVPEELDLPGNARRYGTVPDIQSGRHIPHINVRDLDVLEDAELANHGNVPDFLAMDFPDLLAQPDALLVRWPAPSD